MGACQERHFGPGVQMSYPGSSGPGCVDGSEEANPVPVAAHGVDTIATAEGRCHAELYLVSRTPSPERRGGVEFQLDEPESGLGDAAHMAAASYG
ncbi:MAG TPA: hypothetical protein VNJ04_13630 [Gemmatimonadaceae bacterium]|nr:hypothetical protein [Gemmatimonadaceae bacterium]